ncbi:acyl-CoA synthetase [Actinocorallia lasiicapitis]
MMEFNHADLFEAVADAVPDRPALVVGKERLTYAELDRRANRLAHLLRGLGVRAGQRVAIQLVNGAEYAVGLLAALKIRAVPVNVNFRYTAAELRYLYRDSGAAALLYGAEFDDRVAEAVRRLPGLPVLIAVGGPSSIERAITYEDAIAGQPDVRGFEPRRADDHYIIYTGGTTGVPKGVVWNCRDMLFAFTNALKEPPSTPSGMVAAAVATPPSVMFPVAPLMHGAAQTATFIAWLTMAATLVYTPGFDPAEIWRTAARERATYLLVTGDAMVIPLIDTLAENKDAYDLSSLVVLMSTGAILTPAIRERAGRLLPGVMVLDRFGSTESGSTGGLPSAEPGRGLVFVPDAAGVAVLDEDLKPVRPGSGTLGQVARTGFLPVGYHGDPEKTARTFPTVDGVRWLLTGDLATVEQDGTIVVHGRGSQVINTGGEKVFPEEVETVLKTHPGVMDAVVTGLPDDRFGQRVVAIVRRYDPRHGPGHLELDGHCRELLAGYKAPRSYVFVEEVRRSPAGKADYRWAQQIAAGAGTDPDAGR